MHASTPAREWYAHPQQTAQTHVLGTGANNTRAAPEELLCQLIHLRVRHLRVEHASHKFAGSTPATKLPRAGRSRQQHSFWHAFHAARGAQLAFPSARNVPMPEKQPPAFRSVQPAARHHKAGGATRDRTRTPRTGGRGISQSDQPRRAARPHSCEQRGPATARACRSCVPLPLLSRAWCPALAHCLDCGRGVDSFETPAGRAFMSTSTGCNKLEPAKKGRMPLSSLQREDARRGTYTAPQPMPGTGL